MQKNILYKFVYIIAVILIFNSVKSQNVEFTKSNFADKKGDFKKAKKYIRKGNRYCSWQGIDVAEGISYYLRANDINPKSATLNYKIGKAYLNSFEKSKAYDYILKASTLDETVAPDIHYLLAQVYHLKMDWDKAIAEYKKYLSGLSSKDQNLLNEEVTRRIKQCETGKELVKTPVKSFIDNLGKGINTINDEYGVVVNPDETQMYFTSKREDNLRGRILELTNLYYEDIYNAESKNNVWQNAENYGKPLNSKYNDAVAGMSSDGKILYVYRSRKRPGDIYESELKDEAKWSKPSRLSKKINSKKYHQTSASISPDGKTIYFVSNRKGGIGGRDIYYCTADEKGRWSDPQNIGLPINTPYDEEFPYIAADGKTLYFSSNGQNTIGGFDIFKTVYENGKWSAPVNMGYPINTPYNEYSYFVSSKSSSHAYYSSARDGGNGGQDIYKITYITDKPVINAEDNNYLAAKTMPVSETSMELPLEIKENSMIAIKGIITDAANNQPLQASIEITDNKLNTTVVNSQSDGKTGKYLVTVLSGKNYGITVKSDGYMFSSDNINIPFTTQYVEANKDFALKKIEAGTKIVLNNIFFDFGKASLRKESTPELDRVYKLLVDVPKLKIEISGHTDNKGNVEINQKLSESRAKSVVDYLISKGISADRLVFKGYGFTQPVAPNDTEKNRQLNRRTEFKIISK